MIHLFQKRFVMYGRTVKDQINPQRRIKKITNRTFPELIWLLIHLLIFSEIVAIVG